MAETVATSPPETAPPVPVPNPDVVMFRNVTKAFGAGPQARVAIQDVSFTVADLPDRGELVTLVGPSGCGKSTVLRLIAGLAPHFPPTQGEVLAQGCPITGPGADRGVVDQRYSLLPHLTVLDNIAFGLRLRGVGRAERCEQAAAWARRVGLEGAERKYPTELSGGMQQRVAIAATLILKPRILLMDEPFGALDPKIRLRMQELLVELWRDQQATVFFVTHSIEEAIYLGDRIFRMTANPGRLVEIVPAPRPDEPPEVSRRQPWFQALARDLLERLETDAPAAAGGRIGPPQ